MPRIKQNYTDLLRETRVSRARNKTEKLFSPFPSIVVFFEIAKTEITRQPPELFDSSFERNYLYPLCNQLSALTISRFVLVDPDL